MRKTLGTFFYVGYVPFAPGTAASLVAAALIAVLVLLGGPAAVLPVLALAVGGIACVVARHAVEDYGSEDPKRFVLDEVVGMLVAMSFVPVGTTQQVMLATATAFVAFRVFDIAKPFPVSAAERIPGGVGVVADDVVAGAFANVVTQIAGVLFWMGS